MPPPPPHRLPPHRLLEMRTGLVRVLGVVVQDAAQLEVGAGLDALRRLELEDGLQAVHAQLDLGRAGRPEVLGKAEKGQIPGICVLRLLLRGLRLRLRLGLLLLRAASANRRHLTRIRDKHRERWGRSESGPGGGAWDPGDVMGSST